MIQTEAKARRLYEGETFAVWGIRRGWHFWTGHKWELAPYRVKLFSTEEEATAYLRKRAFQDYDGDKAEVVGFSMKHK